MAYCKICGEYECKKHTVLLGRTRYVNEFSGSSPPEVFVGKWNYPNVYAGILSPEEYGDTRIMSSAEEWRAKKLAIPDILELRNKLIYGRNRTNIKKAVLNSKFISVMQEIAMTDSSVSAEFKLKRAVRRNDERESRVPLISSAGEVEKVQLQENPKIKKKVEYLVNDNDVKSADALIELQSAQISTSSMIKLLSAGLLGLKKNRKLVPTRWAITAVDSNLSSEKIEKIRYMPELSEYRVFHDEYLGNHYEILLIPRYWSFEVIEISLKNFLVWKDFESIFKRRSYADNVTGAYYANRLGICEYLEKIGRQASVIVFREIRPEYYSPLGVGILRETTRSAMANSFRNFDNLSDALADIQTRLRISVERYLKESQMIRELRQKRLGDYLR
ncbi:MAG: hypothetical protein AABX83_04120 [Nanoarchaeota archaeon]